MSIKPHVFARFFMSVWSLKPWILSLIESCSTPNESKRDPLQNDVNVHVKVKKLSNFVCCNTCHKLVFFYQQVNGEVGFPESNYQISSDHSVLTIHSARQSGTVWCIARNAYGATNEKAYLWIRLRMFTIRKIDLIYYEFRTISI